MSILALYTTVFQKWQGEAGGGVTQKKKESKNCEVSQISWPFIGLINLRSELDTEPARGRKAARYPEARPRRHQPMPEREQENREKRGGVLEMTKMTILREKLTRTQQAKKMRPRTANNFFSWHFLFTPVTVRQYGVARRTGLRRFMWSKKHQSPCKCTTYPQLSQTLKRHAKRFGCKSRFFLKNGHFWWILALFWRNLQKHSKRLWNSRSGFQNVRKKSSRGEWVYAVLSGRTNANPILNRARMGNFLDQKAPC